MSDNNNKSRGSKVLSAIASVFFALTVSVVIFLIFRTMSN